MTLAAGRDLAARGFKVFPIAAGKKFPPLVDDWPAAATRDRATIKRWAEQHPDCNWGVHCEGRIVVDVDPKNDGEEWLEALVQDHGGWKGDTLTASTPSGGRHLFFQSGVNVPNSVGKVAQGVDVRSARGYVVGAGSKTDAGDYAWATDVPSRVAPTWLAEVCMAAKKAAEVLDEAPDYVDQTAAVARAREWLAETATPEHGARDATVVQVAAQLKDFGVEWGHAEELLLTWAEPMDWDDFSDDQFLKCVRQGYKTANEAGSKSLEAVADMFDVIPDAIPRRAVDPFDGLMYRPTDIELSEVMGLNYLVKGWLDIGSLAMMFGKWGSGKTFNALDLCAHVASGNEWFGSRVRQGGVLFLGYEGASAMRRRLFALRLHYPNWDWSETPFYIRNMRNALVSKRAGGDTLPAGQLILNRTLSEYHEREGCHPALIVVDPLRNALGGSDSDPELTAPYIELMQKLTAKLGCTTLTIHHPGHGSDDRGRGDSGIEAAMDTVIRVDGDLGRLSSTKQRDDAKGSVYYKLTVVELGLDADGDPRTTCVVDEVADNPLDPMLTNSQRALWDKLNELSDDDGYLKRSAVQRAGEFTNNVRQEIVALLVKKGYLREDGAGYSIGSGPGSDLFN